MTDDLRYSANLIMQAAEKIACSAKLFAEIEAMKAENEVRRVRGESPAYDGNAFMQVLGSYDAAMRF